VGCTGFEPDRALKNPAVRDFSEGARLRVGRTGVEPVTSCLSSKRSEPTELTSLLNVKIIFNFYLL
jgi:hypothetical protein